MSDFPPPWIDRSEAARSVAQFHLRGGVHRNAWLNEEVRNFRSTLISEETVEAMDAIDGFDRRTGEYGMPVRADVAKELADMLYVTYGAADAFGIPLDAVFRLVHASNMTKLQPSGLVLRGDGKIMKPPTYRAPDLSNLIGD